MRGCVIHEKEREAREDRANDLGDDVGDRVAEPDLAADQQADGHRRVDVDAGNVTQCVDHGHDRQAVCQGNARERIGVAGGNRTAADERQSKRADQFCQVRFVVCGDIHGGLHIKRTQSVRVFASFRCAVSSDYFMLKRLATSSQFTTFHQAST